MQVQVDIEFDQLVKIVKLYQPGNCGNLRLRLKRKR